MLLLAVLEATLPRVLLAEWARPSLLVPLIFFFSLRLNTLEGALLALLAGFAQEATGGYPQGRSAFVMVLLFVLARVVLSGVRVDGRAFSIAFCGALAAVCQLVTMLLASSFEGLQTPATQQPFLRAMAWNLAATMVAAAPVLSAARRVNGIGARASEFS